jgi:hypothetical protein
MAEFGYLLDARVLPRIIGQPQLAIVIHQPPSAWASCSAPRTAVWGHEIQTCATPFTNGIINAARVILRSKASP